MSPHATANGVTVAVSAKHGRIACLTARLDEDGAAVLSPPVVYAAEAPRVLGASYKLQQQSMELGSVIDLVLLPASRSTEGQAPQQQEHLAVLTQRYGVCLLQL